MKNFFSYLLSVLLIMNLSTPIVHASEDKNLINSSQIIITKQYAESYCNAKADHFFDGLDNEKTLKYSYFKYIGFQNKDVFSNDIYKQLINVIREKCVITDKEIREIDKIIFNKP